MQRVKIYNDLLHLIDEWMNADMFVEGRKTAPPPPLSLSLSFLGGGERPLRPPLDPPLAIVSLYLTAFNIL
jgi:hypothetical protein